MNESTSPRRAAHVRLCAMLLLIAAIGFVRADQVEMQNGDRYAGKVLSISEDTLVLQNDVLGTVKLPRGKVAHITLTPVTKVETATKVSRTNAPSPAPATAGNKSSSLALPQLKTNATSLQQVREQFLGDASPEAIAKFNELAGGLLTGKLSVADIRAQAKSAADQLRALKADLGEDSGIALDGYLAILDNFLKEAKSSGDPATNAAGQGPKSNSESPTKAD